MTTTTQPEQTTPEPGRFERLPIFVDVVVDADTHPLPESRISDHHVSLEFESSPTRLAIMVRGSRHSQAAWLSALGAELTVLARRIEESAR